MAKHILFLHGGGDGAYISDRQQVAHLQKALGVEYKVVYPQMPDENAPQYAAWKQQIAKELAAIDGAVIIVGHSLGASIALKYVSEETVDQPIAGLFLVATPFWGADDWEVDEYTLRDDFPAHLPKDTLIYLYHSHDDEVIPTEHLAMYTARLPNAIVREVIGRDHQFNNDLTEVAADILNL